MAKQSSQTRSPLNEGTSCSLPRLQPTETESGVVYSLYGVISEEVRARFGNILIGFACSLLTSSMEQVVINTTTHPALARIRRKLAEAVALAEPVMRAHVAAGASGIGAKLPEP